jgi:hypothetical protein
VLVEQQKELVELGGAWGGGSVPARASDHATACRAYRINASAYRAITPFVNARERIEWVKQVPQRLQQRQHGFHFKRLSLMYYMVQVGNSDRRRSIKIVAFTLLKLQSPP